MAIAQRTKIVPKDLGDPSIIKLQPEETKRYMLGTIIGIVTGFVFRADLKDADRKMEGLSGSFRSIPADEKRDELESGILWLPDAFHNIIAATFRKMSEDDKNAQLRFAYEIYSIRASNPIGYSWEFKPKIEATGGNPLNELLSDLGEIKSVNGKRVLALAGPNVESLPKAVAGGKAK
jgi:hypothetical protein